MSGVLKIRLMADLIDVDGNVFIDYAGGIGTMNIGHSHPRVLAAIKEQVDKYIHPLPLLLTALCYLSRKVV